MGISIPLFLLWIARLFTIEYVGSLEINNAALGSMNSFDNYHGRRRLMRREMIDPPALNIDHLQHFKLYIVYNAYIYPQRPHFLEVIREQLQTFHCNGLFKRADKTFVSLSIDHTTEVSTKSARTVRHVVEAVQNLTIDAIIDVTLDNRFEYPGIKRVWDIAHQLPTEEEANNTIIIYYHSKGMVNTYLPNFNGIRVPFDIIYNHLTFDRWDEVLNMFNNHSELNKVGCAPAKEGHIWFNIWYARASYIQRLVNPTISSDRYYYEMWLGKRSEHGPNMWPKVERIEFVEQDVNRGVSAGCEDCWSTCVPGNYSLGTYFVPPTFPKAVNKIPWHRCRSNYTHRMEAISHQHNTIDVLMQI